MPPGSGRGRPVALSHRPRPVAQRAAAVGLSAASLILAAACSSGSRPASTPPDPRQALLAAANQAQRINSGTETITIRESGTSSSLMTGTIRLRLKPTLLMSENLNATSAGANTRIKVILTSTAIYLSYPPLTRQYGKPWVKLSLSALTGSTGAIFTQLLRSLQNNTFTNQARLVAVAKDIRVVGRQTLDGVPATEYAGSFDAAQALSALPGSLRKAMAPELQVLGHNTIRFHEWIDGQHHLRKMAEVVTVDGDTVNTTLHVTGINQPVSISQPPASQTFNLQGKPGIRDG